MSPCADAPLALLLVGHGGMGRRYVAALAEIPEAHLAGVVVTTEDSVARAEDALRVPAGTSLDAMITRTRPDALIVASPTEHHEAAVQAAIRARLPCLVEKPVTSDLAGCARLIEANREARVPILVGHTLVFAPSFLRLLALIDSGRLGELRGVTLRSEVAIGDGWDARSDGYWRRSFLENLVLHRVALMNHLLARLGGGPVRHALEAFDPAPGQERMDFRLWDGAGASHPLSLSIGAEASVVSAQVRMARGVFSWRSGAGGERLSFEPEGAAPREVPFARGQALVRQVEAFVDFARTGEPPFEGLQQGLDALRTTQELIASVLDVPGPRVRRALEELAAGSGTMVEEDGHDMLRFRAAETQHIMTVLQDSGANGHADTFADWPEPEELAFNAGLKPVLYRTVPLTEAEAVVARFPGVPVTRVAHTLAHEEVQDRRRRGGQGAPHVDLFFSRDPALAERAAEIYRDGQVSRHVEEMGALLGYPPCCVAAFAALPDRANNSFLRHATRLATHLDEGPFDPFLNNLSLVATPFYPCSYRCAEAGRRSREVLREELVPQIARFLRWLSMPVLYVDDARMVLLEGQGDAREVRYERVWVPPAGGAARTAARARFVEEVVAPLSLGDRVVVDEREILVWSGEREVARLEKRWEDLGVLFPFG